jgi:hypothetical protein
MTSTESRTTTTQQQRVEPENEALLTLELEYVKPSLPPPVGLDYRQCLESPTSVDPHIIQTSDEEGQQQQQQEEREIFGNQNSSDIHPAASVVVSERNRCHCRQTVLLTLTTILPIAALLVATLFVSTHISCHHKEQREHRGNPPLDVVHSPPHHTTSNTTISSKVSTTTAPTLQASWSVIIVPHHKQQEIYYNYSGQEGEDQQQEEEDGAE